MSKTDIINGLVAAAKVTHSRFDSVCDTIIKEHYDRGNIEERDAVVEIKREYHLYAGIHETLGHKL